MAKASMTCCQLAPMPLVLTAEFPPTSGDATLAGYSVTKEPKKTHCRVGYCHQFDARLVTSLMLTLTTSRDTVVG